ncbi:acyltransferase [Cerasicoccus fimbriatus]|uniref:acyltransferase n=1 Tax=Cerasicoccus fimbriatus TaxID=3014554 RepID=UPI0022B51E37|nr:acyltransferase [Cerasicoccus sp. TK19100]
MFFDAWRTAKRGLLGLFWTARDILFFRLSRIICGKNFKSVGRIYWHVHRRGQLMIGSNVRILSSYSANVVGAENRACIQVLPGGFLSIGDCVGISNSTIVCFREITIESNVFIGGGCHIYDTNFHDLNAQRRVSQVDEVIDSAPIILREYCFIGAHAIILKGVEIGRESIIAAGSLVTNNVPAREVWGGVPAKYIRKIDE